MLEAKGFEVNKQNITEASWYSFTQKLIYKAESAGRSIILVNPANTSKMCSRCGHIKKNLSLKDREYICEKCGLIINRDLNSAKNVKNIGLNLLGISNAITIRKVISEAPALGWGNSLS
jgi:putative transposase